MAFEKKKNFEVWPPQAIYSVTNCHKFSCLLPITYNTGSACSPTHGNPIWYIEKSAMTSRKLLYI